MKLLARITEDDARKTLCDSHFDALATKGASVKHALRPTLPAGGLPALARGEMASWESPVMYHVHSFGKDNDAGPDKGWNVTTIRNDTTTIQVARVLYGRQLDVQPRPAALTYLVHANQTAGNSSGDAILSHYISTSGPSGFDQILGAQIRGGPPLRASWPLFLTVPAREDAYARRLTGTETVQASAPRPKPLWPFAPPHSTLPTPVLQAKLHTYDTKGLPVEVDVMVDVTLDYYAGTSDGFAGYGTMCPMKPPAPQSPSTCIGGM